jgi:hypothetical protein
MMWLKCEYCRSLCEYILFYLHRHIRREEGISVTYVLKCDSTYYDSAPGIYASFLYGTTERVCVLFVRYFALRYISNHCLL